MRARICAAAVALVCVVLWRGGGLADGGCLLQVNLLWVRGPAREERTDIKGGTSRRDGEGASPSLRVNSPDTAHSSDSLPGAPTHLHRACPETTYLTTCNLTLLFFLSFFVPGPPLKDRAPLGKRYILQ